jgi:hypothetical protein
MKTKSPKTREDVPFDPVLLAATVPSRKPTPQDLADAKERSDDAIEPRDYPSMEKAVRDL